MRRSAAELPLRCSARAASGRGGIAIGDEVFD